VKVENGPLVSVLLLTRDAGPRLSTVLAAVLRQEAPFRFEVVALDSGSTDGTQERLRQAGVRLVPVSPLEFNHGTTRNRGVRACRGAFVVMLVQDAEPETPGWLAALVAPLVGDEALAGTYARQVPVEGAGCVPRAYLAGYAAAAPEPRVQGLPDRGVFEALPPAERLRLCTFDNVCSCIRRSAWSRLPFPEVPIAEDLQWAREVLLEGYRLAYVPEARVRHLHDRPASYELKRTYLVHQQLRRLFGLRTIPSSVHLARAVATSLACHARWIAAAPAPWRQKIAEMPRAAALAFALPLGQYLGARSADAGRELLRVRGV
jgi:rhamnosyltransferase